MADTAESGRVASSWMSASVVTIWTNTTVTTISGCPAKYRSGPSIATENSVMLATLPRTIIASSDVLPW